MLFNVTTHFNIGPLLKNLLTRKTTMIMKTKKLKKWTLKPDDHLVKNINLSM